MTVEIEPFAESDLSMHVLGLIDEHLEAMREIRDRMRMGGRITPGGRRTLALESAMVAERYAERLTRALEHND